MGITTLPSGRFRLQVRRQGLPTVDETFDSKTEAEAALRDAMQREAAPNQGEATLSQVWELYADSYEFKHKADNTQSTERCRIQPVLKALGQYSLKNLEQSPNAIYDYIDRRIRTISERTGKPISAASVRLEIAALSAVVAFAKKRRMTLGNFVRHIDRPTVKKRKRRVPPTEQGMLQLAAHTHFTQTTTPARFVLLLRLLGCRPSELAGLLKADVNLIRSEVLFRNTKNGTDRRIHVTESAVGLIAAQIESTDSKAPFVFPSLTHRKEWRPYNYSHGIKLLKQAGIVGADFHAHAGRREFISRAIEAGLPYATIRKQTGHKSTQAIEIYDEGLSTAPEIRAALDRHEKTVKDEQLIGAFEAYGLTGEDLERVIAKLEHREPKTGWIDPFAEKKRRLNRSDHG